MQDEEEWPHAVSRGLTYYPCDACCPLQMSDTSFQPSPRGEVFHFFLKNRCKGPNLNRIAKGSACAMRFDVINLLRLKIVLALNLRE